jgi:hypothetical protein
MMRKLRNLKNRCVRRLRIKRLVWRVSLLSRLDDVKASEPRQKSRLKVKITRVTRNMFRSR